MKIRFVLAALAAAACGFVVHVALLGFINPVVSRAMQAFAEAGGHLTRPEESRAITVLAAVTSIVEQGPAFVLAFLLVAKALPTRSRPTQGLVCAALLLAVRGDLIRMPVMNIAIGNPIWIALLQQSERWLAVVAACLAAAVLVPRDEAVRQEAIARV